MFKNEAFWVRHIKTSGSFGFPPREVDVAIIGGGLCGLAVMYWLLQFDVHCVLLEKNWLGSRSTSRTIGAINVVPDCSLNSANESDVLKRIELASTNRDLILSMMSTFCTTDDACGLVRNGGIQLAASEPQVAQLEVLHRFLAENKIPCEELSSDEITRLVEGRNFATGLYYPREMTVDPYKLCLLLRDACMTHPKFSIVEQFHVDRTSSDDDGVEIFSDDGTKVRASLVVYCTDEALAHDIKYPDEIQNADVVSVQGTALRIQGHKLTPMSCRTISGMNGWIFSKDHMIYAFRNGQVVNGTAYYSHNDDDIRAAHKFITRYMPAIAHAGQQECIWSDFYMKTNQLLPYVGLAPDSDRILLNTGYGYDFMDLFFVNGRRIAQMVGERLLDGVS